MNYHESVAVPLQEISEKLSGEIIKMCDEVKESGIVLAPFVHLSNNIAASRDVIRFFNMLENDIKSKGVFKVARTHFGSHKSLLMDVHGHPVSVRYREY